MEERTSIVVEEYLQAIYLLQSSGQRVKSVDLANKLKSSPSTVHATIVRLQKNNLITQNSKKEIELTEHGLARAQQLDRRHKLVENFLCETLGIPWHEVHKHAHILEHGLTPLIEEKLAEFLGFPEYCPHGDPISGSKKDLPKNLIYLDQCQVGDKIKIVIVAESMEDSVELMKHLHDNNVIPGKEHQVIEKKDVTETLILISEEKQAVLPYKIAKNIGVVLI